MNKGLIKTISSLIVVLAFLFFSAAAAHCAKVTLQWNSVAEAKGYIVYYGSESENYSTTQDVKNQTSCSISVDPGTYYFAVTAYNSYGESGYSDEISCKVAANADPNCLSQKLKATSKICSAYARCYMRGMKNSILNIDGCVSEAENKFESQWDKAESKAGAAGCSTAAATVIEDILFFGFGALSGQISEGLDPEDKKAVSLGQSLLKAAGAWYSSLLSAESAYVKTSNSGKFQAARDKADAKFKKSWDKAITMAEKNGVTFFGLSAGGAEDIINSDNVISDIILEMGY